MIIFLGAAVFSGLRNTPYTMASSVDTYLNNHNYADLTYIATLGFSDEDVAKVRSLKGVKKVVPCYQFDALFSHKDGKSGVTVYSQDHYDQNMLDRPEIVKGRYPKKEDECIIDVNLGKYNYKIGHTIELSNDNGTKTYKIVGIVNDPRYISNVDRGTNTLGDGTNSGFVEVLNDGARELGLNSKVAQIRNNDRLYTSLLVDVEGAQNYDLFSSDYDDMIETVNTRIKSTLSEEISDQYDQLTGDMQSQLDDAKKQYEEGYQEYKRNLDSFNSQISEGKVKLAQARIQFYEQKKVYLKKASQVTQASQQAYNETKKIDQEIKTLQNSIKDTLGSIKDKESAEDAYTKILTEMSESLGQFNQKLQGVGRLLEGRIQLEKAQSQLDEAEAELNIQQSKLEVTENNAKLKLNSAKEQLDQAKAQIEQAESQLSQIPKGTLYSLTKSENVGIATYESYKQAIASIAQVFPLIFFLVAALVSLTTMTRMIEEQRGYCGTLRALGYSKQDVIMQYIVYAFLATFFACILGILVGNQAFPRIIYFLFTYLMYGINQSAVLVQKWSISLVTILISVGVTLLATLSVCLQELVSTPSVLMRPKAPKAGKRILMERIPFIWKRLNFNQKVTMRNLFRYKKRFWMSVIGIAGCTALIMLGFGVKNSCSEIIPSQYVEVYKYDALIKLNSNVEDTKKIENKIKQDGERAVIETGVHHLHPELMKLLGRMRYRTSYGQNVLEHSIEVAKLAGSMAAELGLDPTLARRAGLLHDIGKALDHEIEGSHVQIGVDICRKYKENTQIIHAIEAHHGDVEPKTPLAFIIQACDAISAARPGARRENMESYIKRLETLEALCNGFEGVESSYAVQAGREVRILVQPDKVSDDEVILLARNVAKKIENELDYPGQIKVSVIRESRATEYAK